MEITYNLRFYSHCLENVYNIILRLWTHCVDNLFSKKNEFALDFYIIKWYNIIVKSQGLKFII